MDHTGSAMRDVLLMRRALTLAALGPLGDPNPRVGAVILDAEGRVVGEGFHRGAGTPHAEAAALAVAGERARGGTCYVTLEPCDHVGRTPACSAALVDAGVARVVVASADPNPTATGGIERLRRAGIVVEVGLSGVEAEALNPAWLYAMRTGRPFVTWKVASTLDGRIAAADGTSRWITGPQARQDVHALRARVGAVLVGTGTAFADDPSLTVRDEDGEPAGRQPLRAVMGLRCADVPAGARLRDDAAETAFLDTRDPHEALTELTRRQVRHVLLEGGATLAAAFWREGLVDEVVAYLAPALLGAGAASLADFGVTTIGETVRLQVDDVALVGQDVRITARPQRAGAHSSGVPGPGAERDGRQNADGQDVGAQHADAQDGAVADSSAQGSAAQTLGAEEPPAGASGPEKSSAATSGAEKSSAKNSRAEKSSAKRSRVKKSER